MESYSKLSNLLFSHFFIGKGYDICGGTSTLENDDGYVVSDVRFDDVDTAEIASKHEGHYWDMSPF